jgi:hypothetical protein
MAVGDPVPASELRALVIEQLSASTSIDTDRWTEIVSRITVSHIASQECNWSVLISRAAPIERDAIAKAAETIRSKYPRALRAERSRISQL